jgi:small subunit ribosomal protein S4e
MDQCLTLTLVLRDLLGVAKTAKEAKTIVSQGKVYVDGKIRRDESYPTGFMDVLAFPDSNRSYRVLPSPKGLILHPIEKEEANFKLCRIENKTAIKKGHVQLDLHDGTNILVRVADPKKRAEDTYHVLDTLKVGLKGKDIQGYMKLAKGIPVLTMGGKNIGKHGKIVEIEESKGQKRRDLLVTVEDKNGNHFQTTVNFVFVIGDASPSISLPEVA